MKERYKHLLDSVLYHKFDISMNTLWLCNALNRWEYQNNPECVIEDVYYNFKSVEVLMGMMMPTKDERLEYCIQEGNVWLCSYTNSTKEDNEFRLMVAQLMYLLIDDPENIAYAVEYYKSEIASKYKM